MKYGMFKKYEIDYEIQIIDAFKHAFKTLF